MSVEPAMSGEPAVLPRTSDGPVLTVIVAFYNMKREAERTLFTLTPSYQQGVTVDEYEVIAVDNGSSDPLGSELVESFGKNFRYTYEQTTSPSPAAAINRAARAATTPWVACLIDGARMLSPGIVANILLGRRLSAASLVYTAAMHVGPELQNALSARGYEPADEDALLDTIPWRTDGYKLFRVSTFAASSRGGFFKPLTESNCFALDRTRFLDLGGFDERFELPGGGLVNLEVFERLIRRTAPMQIALLGEATFHQFHGGVATNVPFADHPWRSFAEEYEALMGHPYRPPAYSPLYLGRLSLEAAGAALRASDVFDL
jgi:glycosyltransferase involved in cell wall biosynthesis